ncbi:hypothetical protein EDL79_01775 [Ehrlichia ruminantium]|uniref:Uncharacterized protein n=1 Tax=Ehrlichia ruminantium TaxID=779 RepID=A0AAE6QCZ4_EHRRU|nr:hypothetical protein [Ehrlichia ruminantium]QGR02401.1 hypothetical protein EDL81_01780 [Ehrlichia ruminantium]QGR03320.1 hypothetical protein EDL80_01775 [Ehrlichia ruminantium]QGR04246.1 hypothetical protein EDL79_01775 [Ehrlichia ruminantium]
MILSTSSQNKINEGYLSNLGNKIDDLCNTSPDIKHRFNYRLEEQNIQSINYTFSMPCQNNIENSKDLDLNNMTCSQSPKYQISSAILVDASSQPQLTHQDIQNTADTDHITDQEQSETDENSIIYQQDEISYKVAYNLLLNLVNNDIKLLKEVLLVAESLVQEGVLVAPESKVKKHVAKAILSKVQQYRKNSNSRSR